MNKVMNPPEDNMLILGALLRCPAGEKAIAVGDYMFAQNAEMIAQTLACVPLPAGSRVLEVGFGNGKHLPCLFAQVPKVQYVGLETSGAMVAEATACNAEAVARGQAVFKQVAPDTLPQLSPLFDVCLAVNTIYFITDLPQYTAQLYQLLAVGGTLAFAFIDKAIGEKLPFAKEGFRFYTADEVSLLLKTVGFANITSQLFRQEMLTAKGKKITRYYYVITGEKSYAFGLF